MIDTDSQGTQASLCRAIASCCFMQYVLTIVSTDESFERHFYQFFSLCLTYGVLLGFSVLSLFI